jgi:aspartyl-tRNA(Asn)/glutamyl-tRNA(Gln) amidotransferase subunit C
MLDRAQVLHVARLASLELTDPEIEQMAAELSKVLEHFEKIGELDLEGVPPTSHVVEVTDTLRPDDPEASLPAEVVLASAPEPLEGGGRRPHPRRGSRPAGAVRALPVAGGRRRAERVHLGGRSGARSARGWPAAGRRARRGQGPVLH